MARTLGRDLAQAVDERGQGLPLTAFLDQGLAKQEPGREAIHGEHAGPWFGRLVEQRTSSGLRARKVVHRADELRQRRTASGRRLSRGFALRQARREQLDRDARQAALRDLARDDPEGAMGFRDAVVLRDLQGPRTHVTGASRQRGCGGRPRAAARRSSARSRSPGGDDPDEDGPAEARAPTDSAIGRPYREAA